MSLEERVKELRDIRDIKEFSKSVDYIIENYIKHGDVGLNWIELTSYIDDLYKSMNECNKNKEKLGITFINDNNALVFILREKIREILREANAIVGYDEIEAFNIRLVNSISVDYFKDSIMNVFKEVDNKSVIDETKTFKNVDEVYKFLNKVDVWSELEREGCKELSIVAYQEQDNCIKNDILHNGVILANKEFEHGKEFEILKLIGLKVAERGVSCFERYPGVQEAAMEGYSIGFASSVLRRAGLVNLDVSRYI